MKKLRGLSCNYWRNGEISSKGGTIKWVSRYGLIIITGLKQSSFPFIVFHGY